MSDNFDSNIAQPEENKDNAGDTQNKKGKNVKKEVISWIVTLLTAVVAALLIRTFLFEPVRVDGTSMQDTLIDTELVFVTKPEYLFSTPKRQDVVICRYPTRGSTYFVKRLIGLPGDTLVFTYGRDEVTGLNTTTITANGELLDESYLTPDRNDLLYRFTDLYSRDDIAISQSEDRTQVTIVLGENQYFVMGDNRDNSNDSRAQGPIERNAIIGHVQFVFFPFNKIRGIN